MLRRRSSRGGGDLGGDLGRRFGGMMSEMVEGEALFFSLSFLGCFGRELGDRFLLRIAWRSGDD